MTLDLTQLEPQVAAMAVAPRIEDCYAVLTDIDGVGPKTAAKLHSAGIYTYHDLWARYGFLDDVVGKAGARKIQAWLSAREGWKGESDDTRSEAT